jgi:hypothetical protein
MNCHTIETLKNGEANYNRKEFKKRRKIREANNV